MSKNIIPDDIVRQAAENIVGGMWGSVESEVELLGYDGNDITYEQYELIVDDILFKCVICEWWCYEGEQDMSIEHPDGMVCHDCGQYYEEE